MRARCSRRSAGMSRTPSRAPLATPSSISLNLSCLGLPPTVGHPPSLPPSSTTPARGISPKSVPFRVILCHFVAGSLCGQSCLERLAKPDSGTGDTKCSGNVTGRRRVPNTHLHPHPRIDTGQALTFPHQGGRDLWLTGSVPRRWESSTGVRGVQGGGGIGGLRSMAGRRLLIWDRL